MAFLPRHELEKLGFASLGVDVSISDKASLYNTGRISIGSHVRIDDFCILSGGPGGIEIANYVHIAAYSSLIGAGKIILSDFSNLSSRVSIYSSNDDYTGASLTNPTIPENYKDVTHKDVMVGRHVIIGSGSIVLPGVILEEGVAVGALSLVMKRCEAFSIYAGNPAKRIKGRSRELLEVERRFLDERSINER